MHRDLQTTSIYVTHDQLEAMTLADRIVLMKEGRIEQMGTPEDIYQTPATLFASGFIGTPNMNFLKLQANDGMLADSSIKLAAPFAVKSGPVTVGICPGAIRLNEAGGAVRGQVERNEFHGETRLVTIRTANNEINVAVAASTRVQEGQSIDVHPHDLHLFDPTTERRLKQ